MQLRLCGARAFLPFDADEIAPVRLGLPERLIGGGKIGVRGVDVLIHRRELRLARRAAHHVLALLLIAAGHLAKGMRLLLAVPHRSLTDVLPECLGAAASIGKRLAELVADALRHGGVLVQRLLCRLSGLLSLRRVGVRRVRIASQVVGPGHHPFPLLEVGRPRFIRRPERLILALGVHRGDLFGRERGLRGRGRSRRGLSVRVRLCRCSPRGVGDGAAASASADQALHPFASLLVVVGYRIPNCHVSASFSALEVTVAPRRSTF